MKYLVNFLALVKEVDQLIQVEKTGSNVEFARKLNISTYKLKITIFILINILNAPIEFGKIKNSYYYLEKGKIHLYFQYD